MDFKSLLQSFDTITEGDVVHKGEYGNKYGKEDVRDQYGHKVGKVDKGAQAKKEEPKKGRGRPKKDVGDAGEKFDTSALSNVLGGKKPSKAVGTTSKKHSLKEYMESVEDTKQAEAVMEGLFGGVDHDYVAGNLGKLAKVIKSVQTPEQFKVAQKYAQRMSGTIMKHQHDNSSFGSGLRANLKVMRAIQDDLKAKAAELGIEYQELEETGGDQIEIKPASQTQTQVIQQGNKTLGTVNNPTLAATIKSAIGKGEMQLNPDEEMAEEVDMGQYDARKPVKSEPKGDWDKDFREKVKQYAKELEQRQSSKEEELDEFIDIDTLNQLASHPMAGTMAAAGGAALGGAIGGAVKKAGDWYTNRKEQQAQRNQQTRMAEGKKKPDANKNGIPDYAEDGKGKNDLKKKKVDESISLAESPETLQHIISRYKHEVKNFINGNELDHDLYEALFDYYFDAGSMPYGTAKGRTGDPYEWVTQRFDQDVHDHVVDENTIRDFTQHALKEPTSDFTKPGSPMAVPKGTPTKINRPVPEPTPWSVDPINAATDRAFNFIDSLKKKTPFSEGTDMKDIQLESWDKQLQSLLSEGLTVSSSTGQQGSPNSVTVSATENDADQLMQVLRSAGIGGFGAEPSTPEVGYGVASQGEEDFDGTGTAPQPSPDVVGDDGDMLSMLKKMAGLSGDGEAEVVAVSTDDEGSDDYEDEESSDDTALQPADGEEEESGDESEEDEVEEGNKFTGNLAKARAQGKEEADLDGDGDMEKVREGEDDCMECGMSESSCECDHEEEQVEESFANSSDPAQQELMKLKALLSMGNDLNRQKQSQTVGNPVRAEINDWKKLSGI